MHIVYVIESKATGRYYVGSTSRYARRKADHFSALRRGRHDNPRVQREWDKYGQFEMRPYASAIRAEDLAVLEQELIEEALASGKALNINKDTVRHRLGVRVTEETKQKLSAARTGKRLTQEQKQQRRLRMQNLHNPMQGKRHSEETKAKISAALKRGYVEGRAPTVAPPSAQHRAALAERMRTNPPRKGKGKPLQGEKDGVICVWPTTIACAKALECDLSYPSQRVNTGKRVKGWLLTYIDDTHAG